MKSSENPYAGRRYPGEVIAHAVWLNHGFCLSFRDVQNLLAERGITVSHESVTQWRLKFGRSYQPAAKVCPDEKGGLPPISASPIHLRISASWKGNWLAVPFFRVL